MPIYEYLCAGCNRRVSVWVRRMGQAARAAFEEHYDLPESVACICEILEVPGERRVLTGAAEVSGNPLM